MHYRLDNDWLLRRLVLRGCWTGVARLALYINAPVTDA